MQVNQQLLRSLFSLFILRLDRDLPEGIQPLKLFKTPNSYPLAIVEERLVFSLVDELEVAYPAPNQIRAYLRRVHFLRVAKDIRKQELLLRFCKEEALDWGLLLILVLLVVEERALHSAGLVDPVYEQGLIRLEVWLVDEQSPEFLDVFGSESDCLPRCVSFDLAFADEEFKQV